MSIKIIFMQARQQLNERTGKLSERVSGGLTGEAAYSKTFAAACIQVTPIALHKADEFTKKVPMPAIVIKHFSKRETTFIAIAWAIPILGTGLFAAALVIGTRHLRSRLKRRYTLNAISNG